MSIKILGTGSYLPEKIMTNFDFEKIVETSDEWITKRTGIKRRHYSDGMTNADMCVKAAQEALDDAGITVSDLGGIICASVTNEMQVPSVACQVQREMGATCLAFDVNAACSGFMFAMKTAAGFIMQDPQKKPILLLGSETLSRLMNFEDRTTCILFGDGAGAAVVGEGDNLKFIELYSIPDTDHSLEIKGINWNIREGESKFSYVEMDGREIYKFATREVPRVAQEALNATGLEADDVDWVISHQANVRIIETAAKRLGIPMEKFYVNIDDVGNTSAASIPIVMDQMNKKGLLKRGDKVLIAGFGGGLTSACALFEW